MKKYEVIARNIRSPKGLHLTGDIVELDDDTAHLMRHGIKEVPAPAKKRASKKAASK
jgi:hypothetical protein